MVLGMFQPITESDITMKTKLVTAAVALSASLMASAANAQSYSNDPINYTPRGQAFLATATMNSATIPQPVLVNAFENVSLNCVGTATTVSVSTQQILRDGTVVRSATQNCSSTNTQLVSATAANLDVEGYIISPTAGLTGTNTLNIRVLRLPTVPKQF